MESSRFTPGFTLHFREWQESLGYVYHCDMMLAFQNKKLKNGWIMLEQSSFCFGIQLSIYEKIVW